MDGAFENFDEFRSEEDDPAKLVVERLLCSELRNALALLSESERVLLRAIFVEGKSERQIAHELGMPQRTLHDRKARLLGKLKKLLGF